MTSNAPRKQLSKRAYALARRFFQYSFVGVATFLLDILIIVILREFLGVADAIAIGFGFLVGVSANYYFSYHWVFKGTERNLYLGYVIFFGIASLGFASVIVLTLIVQSNTGMNIYFARIIAATIIGIINYLINSIFNFKVVD